MLPVARLRLSSGFRTSLSNSNCPFRTRTVQNKLPMAAPRRTLPINSLLPSSGIIGRLERADPWVLFRTRTVSFELELSLSNSNCPKQASNGRPSSYASYKLLTAIERDYRTSRKGRPLGPLSNSNCLFRTRTVQNKLPMAAPSHALYESLTAVERVSYCLKKAVLFFELELFFSTRRTLTAVKRVLFELELSSLSNSNCLEHAFKGRPQSHALYEFIPLFPTRPPLFRTRSHGCPFIIRTRTSSSGRGVQGAQPPRSGG
jgi:hypothetical protein